ncbi:MAG: CapA family protein [Coriobacteriia bacterium]|nr:CapA family protein [Coriobacteriia bacterium]
MPLRTYGRARRRSGRALRGAGAVLLLVAVVAAAVALVSGVPLPLARGSRGAGAASPPASEPSTAAIPAHAAEPEPEPVESRQATLTVAAVGDMIFDRKVAALIAASGGEAPLARVAPLLARADIAVGNLESPLASGGTRKADKDVTFRGDPRGIEGLRLAGFDFLSLANNHALDYGPEALAETVAALDAAAIGHAGAGGDREAAWRPAIAERHGASVAFLSFSHILPAGFIATSGKAGIAQGRENMPAVLEAIRAAKEEHDYVLVSFHWGVEYADHANGDQVRDAKAAVDAGADMVLAHHPHVIQGVQRYRGALIAYSTGDFVFDHYSRKTGEAFILDAELGPDGVGDVSFTPVYLDGNGRPDVVTGPEARVILQRLRDISAPLGGKVVLTGDTAVLR